MGKSAPSAPVTPTAAETGAASTATNTSTAAAQAALNDTNQVTPYGSTTYNQSGWYTTPGGDTVPRYTQITELDPASQQILDQQRQANVSLGPAEQNLADQTASASTTPLNFNTNFSGTLGQTPQALNGQVTDALYGQQKSFLDPQWDLKQQQLQDQLAKQGISVGSDAYNNATKQLDNSRTQAYQSAADSSIGQGVAAQQGLFGMAQSGQQENIREQMLAQQQPISLLQSLYGAAPQTPQQPLSPTTQTGIAPTDFVGAQAAANNAAMGGYQANVATTNANNGATAGLATAAITAAAIF